jgi:WD40 repeat protein
MADVEGRWAGGRRISFAPILAAALFVGVICQRGRAEPAELRPRVTLKAHEDTVLAVAFSPDGQRLATGGKDERHLLWDLKTNRYVRAFDHDSAISQIRWSPTGTVLGVRGHSGPPVLIDPVKFVAQDMSDNLRLATTKDFAFTRNGQSLLITIGRAVTDPDDTPDELLIWGPFDGFDGFGTLTAGKLRTGLADRQPVPEFKVGRAGQGLDGTLDGATVACQGEVNLKDGCQAIVSVFDVAAGKLTGMIEGDSYSKGAFEGMLRFSPDGGSLLYRKSDRKFAVWDLAAKKDRVEFGADNELTCVGCSPGGCFVAGAQGDKVQVWDARTAQLVYVLAGAGASIAAIDISPGARLVAAAAGNDVLFWALPLANTNDAGLPPAAQPMQAWPPAAPDRRPLAGVPTSPPASQPADEDNPGATARVASIHELASGPQKGDESEDGKLDAPEVRPYAALRSRGNAVLTANFSSDARTLVTAQSSGPVKLWDVATGQPQRSTDRDFDARQLALAPDGHTVAAVDTEGRLLLEDVAADHWRQVDGAEKNSALLFDPISGQFLCGHWDGSVSFWKLGSVNDAEGDKLVRELKGGGKILRLAMSPDGSLLAASGLNRAEQREDAGQQGPTLEVTVWDLKTGEVVASATGGQYEFVPAVGFANDGRTLLYRQNARELIAWDIKGPKRMRMIPLPSPVRLAAFSPDGSCVAMLAAPDERNGQRAAVRILDVASGRVLWELTGIAPTDMVRCVGFSPDGKTVVANSGKVALLWSLPGKTGTPATRPGR